MNLNGAAIQRRSRHSTPLLVVALGAVLSTASAQMPATPVTLSLSEAAKLAARQSAPALAARFRAEQADARVTQRRAELLPNFSASAVENGRTLNTATF